MSANTTFSGYATGSCCARTRLGHVRVVVGRARRRREVKNHPDAPDVGLLRVVVLHEDDFWWRVRRGTAARAAQVRGAFYKPPESKVCDLHLVTHCKQYVLTLQIPVDDVVLVKVTDGAYDLGEVRPGPVLREPSGLCDSLQEVSGSQLHHDVQHPDRALDQINEVDDVVVTDHPQDSHFPRYKLLR